MATKYTAADLAALARARAAAAARQAKRGTGLGVGAVNGSAINPSTK